MEVKVLSCLLRQSHTRILCRYISSRRQNAQQPAAVPHGQYMISNKLTGWMRLYEDYVGITEVKNAHSLVLEAESKFLAVQHERREKQNSLHSIQSRLKALNTELEKIPRSDDRYLKLLTEEHSVLKDEKSLNDEVQSLEIEEREQFAILSSALRDSHEKERTQSEKTKYWSIAGSCIGALIGIIGTTINNQRRMSQLKQMIQSGQITPHILAKIDDVSHSVKELNHTIIEERSMHSNSESNNAEGGRVFQANSNINNNIAIIEEELNERTIALAEKMDKLEKNIQLLLLGSLLSFAVVLSSFVFNR